MTQRLADILVVKKFRDKYDHETIYKPGFRFSAEKDRARDLISRGLAVPATRIPAAAPGDSIDIVPQGVAGPLEADNDQDQDHDASVDLSEDLEAGASRYTAGDEAAEDGNLEAAPDLSEVNDAPKKSKGQKKGK